MARDLAAHDAVKAGADSFYGNVAHGLRAGGRVDDLYHFFSAHLRWCFFADAGADFVFPLLFDFCAHECGGQLPFLSRIELAMTLLFDQRADEFARQGILVDAAIGSAAAEQGGKEEDCGFLHGVFRLVWKGRGLAAEL